jgi:hypothetical protein
MRKICNVLIVVIVVAIMVAFGVLGLMAYQCEAKCNALYDQGTTEWVECVLECPGF